MTNISLYYCSYEQNIKCTRPALSMLFFKSPLPFSHATCIRWSLTIHGSQLFLLKPELFHRCRTGGAVYQVSSRFCTSKGSPFFCFGFYHLFEWRTFFSSYDDKSVGRWLDLPSCSPGQHKPCCLCEEPNPSIIGSLYTPNGHAWE